MLNTTKVNFKHTNIPYKALEWLKEIDNTKTKIACDFEVANKLSNKEKKLLQYRLSKKENHTLKQQIEADGLSHPSLTTITHLSIAWSDRDAIVLICDTDIIKNIIYSWLVNTNTCQIWHNSLFDFRHIIYHTNKIPKQYIDTQLLAKSLLNDADPLESLVGLKELMGYKYGDWALVEDGAFTVENMFNTKMLKYAATDATATYSLYQDIQKDIKSIKEKRSNNV